MKTKTCYSCRSTKPVSEFYKESSMCILCKETLDLDLTGMRGSYNVCLADPPKFCRTCYSCTLTKPLPEFYGNTSLCRICRDEIRIRFKDQRGDYALLVFPAPPFCDICERPRDLIDTSHKWSLMWLCKKCRPHTSCEFCRYYDLCKRRIKIGLWVHCERPSMDDLNKAFRQMEECSKKDANYIHSAIKKVLRHVPKHVLKEEMSNEVAPIVNG